MRLKTLVSLACLSLGAFSAQAELARYGGQAGFTTALVAGSLQVETFDREEPVGNPIFFSGDSGPLKLFGPSSISGPATISGPSAVSDLTPTSGGRAPHSGLLYWEAGQDPFTIEFDSAVKAFGFWGSDIGDFASTGDCEPGELGCVPTTSQVLEISVFFNEAITGELGSITDCEISATDNKVLVCGINGGAANGSELFWGLTSSATAAIQKVSFRNTTASATSGILDGQGFDDFMIGDVNVIDPPPGVPEPGALALVLAALAGVGAARRRRTRR